MNVGNPLVVVRGRRGKQAPLRTDTAIIEPSRQTVKPEHAVAKTGRMGTFQDLMGRISDNPIKFSNEFPMSIQRDTIHDEKDDEA